MQVWKIKDWKLEGEKAGLRRDSVARLYITISRSVNLHGFKLLIPNYNLFK